MAESFGVHHTRDDLIEHLFGIRFDPQALMRALKWIENKLPISNDRQVRNKKIFILYFGFDGVGAVDSVGLGSRFGLTSSAIRKIVDTIYKRLPKEVAQERISAKNFVGDSDE